jgi:hypothetical protein
MMVINIKNLDKMMKKLLYSLLIGASMICLASCMGIDNFDAPDAHISGRVIDATTGQNYVTDHADTRIRIWEKSYSLNPTPQNIPVKADGTYNNSKLFSGTYDMIPFDGPYWPVDTVKGVQIGKKMSVQDFTVTPYLKVIEFKAELSGTTLTMSCRLQAPLTERNGVDLPQILEVRPFLSLTQYCGAANRIDYYYSNDYRVNLRRTWDRIDTTGDGKSDETFTISVEVLKGYTYNVRMGANVNDPYQKFNYSEIIKIVVPNN